MAHEQDRTESATLEPAHHPSGLDLFSLVWRRKSLIALGVVAGVVLGAIYFARLPPIFQSGAQVLVVKKRPDALPLPGIDQRFAYVEDYLGTHQAILRSPLIIQQAVQKGNLRALPSFAGKGDPTAAIIASLSITRGMKEGGATNILVLSYQGPAAEDCGTILRAVIDSYKNFLDVTYRTVSEDAATLVTRARDVLDKQLKEKDEAYRKFRLEHPFLIKSKDGGNLRQERLVSIEGRKLQLADRRAEIQERLRAYDAALKDGRDPADMVGLVLGHVKKENVDLVSRGKPATEDPLLPLLLQEQTLLEDYGPDHPQVQSVRKRIAFLTKKGYSVGLSASSPAAAGVQALKQELVSIQTEEKVLAKLAEAEQEEARKLIESELQEASIRGDLTNTHDLFKTTVKRLQEIDLVKDMGGYDAQTISPANTGLRVGPSPIPIFSVAIFLGLLAGLGLAYYAEISDHSFRSPEEIRRRLGLPVVGYIPLLRPEKEAQPALEGTVLTQDPCLCTLHRPKSTDAEAYRAVRTALFFSTRRDGHTIIQVTSPDMADGKTTLAANLSVSIVQSGKSVLLIDADFRRPRIHKLFGLSPQQGLASVIAGDSDLAQVMQPSGVPGLSILPCGPIPSNPAELLTSPRFQEILRSLAEQYDYVLVDTPPLLAVTDPSVVVPCVDGVLLTMRVTKNGRPNAERARDVLMSLGAKVVGVVINGVSDRGFGPYGSEHYRYGYGRSYAYYTEDGDPSAPGTNGVDGTAPTSNGASEERSGPGTATRAKPARRQGHHHPSRPRLFRWFFNWW